MTPWWAVAGAAMFAILQHRGLDVCGTPWGKQLGAGLFEFRIRVERGSSARSSRPGRSCFAVGPEGTKTPGATAATRASDPSATTVHTTVAAGRNDRCPCGSGRKYKRCCLERHERAMVQRRQLTELAPATEDLLGDVELPDDLATLARTGIEGARRRMIRGSGPGPFTLDELVVVLAAAAPDLERLWNGVEAGQLRDLLRSIARRATAGLGPALERQVLERAMGAPPPGEDPLRWIELGMAVGERFEAVAMVCAVGAPLNALASSAERDLLRAFLDRGPRWRPEDLDPIWQHYGELADALSALNVDRARRILAGGVGRAG